MTNESRIEQLLKRIEQAIYQLDRATLEPSETASSGSEAQTNVTVNLRVEEAIEVEVLEKSPVVFGTLTLAPNATGDIVPPNNEHWVVKAVYHDQSIELYRVREATAIGPVLTNTGAGALLEWNFLLTPSYTLRIKNIGTANATVTYEGRRIVL